MDIALPGMDGLTASIKLKSNPATREIPIVALTAHAMKGDEERAIAAGCCGYITKPLNTRALVPQVQTFLLDAADRLQCVA
jgi:CheY-like chemotaxis protein